MSFDEFTLLRPAASTLRWNAAMKWLRRLHLYTGLLLFPWIILYGITACLFNHPDWFSDRSAAEQLTIPGHVEPGKLAEQVVASMRKHCDDNGMTGKQLRLIKAEEAHFSRQLVAQATLVDGQTYTVSVDLATGQGSTRARSPRPTNKGPAFAQGNHTLEDSPADRVKQAIPEALKKAGLDCKEVQLQTSPELEFQLDVDGELWEMRYSLQRGTLNARNSESTSNLSVRNFMLRLHTAHGYPNEQNIRWFWAIVVDVMFVAMVFWGLSGLFMWWQLKAQRRLGILLLVISASLATWLTWGMHQFMSR
jgi:hypothetical protein